MSAGEFGSNGSLATLGWSKGHGFFGSFTLIAAPSVSFVLRVGTVTLEGSGMTAPALIASTCSLVVLLVVLVEEAEAVKFSLVPFLVKVSDTVAASSSGIVTLLIALTVLFALALSACPLWPVQLFMPFPVSVHVSLVELLLEELVVDLLEVEFVEVVAAGAESDAPKA